MQVRYAVLISRIPMQSYRSPEAERTYENFVLSRSVNILSCHIKKLSYSHQFSENSCQPWQQI